jgi:hypothetical protein
MAADMPKRAHVTCREETVSQGISWMIPPDVDPKPLNRPRKSGELPLAGFDAENAAAEIAAQEPVPPPKPVSEGQGAKGGETAERPGDGFASGGASKSEAGEGDTGGKVLKVSLGSRR